MPVDTGAMSLQALRTPETPPTVMTLVIMSAPISMQRPRTVVLRLSWVLMAGVLMLRRTARRESGVPRSLPPMVITTVPTKMLKPRIGGALIDPGGGMRLSWAALRNGGSEGLGRPGHAARGSRVPL